MTIIQLPLTLTLYRYTKHTTWGGDGYTDLVWEDRDEQPEDGRGDEPAGSVFPVDGHRRRVVMATRRRSDAEVG